MMRALGIVGLCWQGFGGSGLDGALCGLGVWVVSACPALGGGWGGGSIFCPACLGWWCWVRGGGWGGGSIFCPACLGWWCWVRGGVGCVEVSSLPALGGVGCGVGWWWLHFLPCLPWVVVLGAWWCWVRGGVFPACLGWCWVVSALPALGGGWGGGSCCRACPADTTDT